MSTISYESLRLRGLFRTGPFSLLILVLLMSLFWKHDFRAHADVDGKNLSAPGNVIILYSYGDGIPAYQQATRAFLSAMEAGDVSINNLFLEYLDLERKKDIAHYENLTTLLRHKYEGKKIDLVVTLHTKALDFLLNEGKDLFPGSPILSYLSPDRIDTADIERRFLILPMKMDFQGTLELALKLFPQTKRVVFINGVGEGEKRLELEARGVFEQWRGRLEFEYTRDLTVEKMLERIATLPSRTIVLYSNLFRDKTGRTFVPKDMAKVMAKASNSPVFGMYNTLIGNGIIGGSVFNFEVEGLRAGTLALDILNGTLLLTKPVTILSASRTPMFDWQQLKRWGVEAIHLPNDTIFVNRPMSFWERYQKYVVGVVLFMLAQLVMIVLLLLQIRRRKSAEMSLLQKKEELDHFFNISLDLLCIANTEGYFLRLNPIWERILGYSREELMTKRFVDFVHPDDRDATLEAVSTLASQRYIVHFENRYRCKDGTYRWLDWASAPAGAFIYATARDVTERKQAEESLKERLRFETLLAEISAQFINLPAEQIDSAIQETQARICEFLHLERSTLWQACQNDPRSLVLTHIHQPSGSTPPPEWQTAEDLLPWVTQKILNGEVVAISTLAELPPEAGRDRESLHFYKTKSTVGVPLSVGEVPVFGLLSFAVMREERDWSETAVTGFRLIAQVVANALARKRTDRELRDSEARLSLATDAAGAGLWIFYLDTDDVWVSPTTRELFHFAPDEKVTNKSFFKAIHPEDHDRVRQAVQHALHSGEKLKCDYRIVLPDGSIRWLVAHGQRYPATKPVCLMGVSLEITERLNAEAEARQQWEQLAHVTRIGIMGELTASLAHEINQPLTAIQSNAEAAQRFLSRSEPDIDEVRQILEDIVRDNTRASDIIRKIRALLKREAAAFEVLDVNDLIRDVLSLLRADSLLRELVIDAEVFPALPPVLGDRIQLQQVIINLILNGAAAMKNTPPERRKLIIETAIQEDRTVRVSVADFGTGVDESAMGHLFEPFYTTKSEGLGMGLAISRTIIKAHGGTLEASNNPEGGATFAFTLPAYQGDPA